MVLDLLGSKRAAAKDFPEDRYVWIFGVTPMFSPLHSIDAGARTLDEALDHIEEELADAIAQGCVGFKNLMGYYRELRVGAPDHHEATDAFSRIVAAKPARFETSFMAGRRAIYDSAVDGDVRVYEDFVIRHIMRRAGETGMLQLIHTGAQSTPSQNLEFAHPAQLFSLVSDPTLTDTTVVLLHGGAPFHEEAAYMAWQFPHLYVDVSHITHTPGRLGGMLNTLLSIAPAHKILYGSDAFACAEWLGFSAYHMRKALAPVLRDLADVNQWSPRELEDVARMVLGENARRLLPDSVPS